MNWASWLGIENDKVQMKQESSCVVDANDDESHELNKPDVVAESEKSVRQFLQKANGLRGKCHGTLLSLTSCVRSSLSMCLNPVNVTKMSFSTGFVYDFASSASKKLSESVIERAQTLKKSVEEGNIHGIINKVRGSSGLFVPPDSVMSLRKGQLSVFLRLFWVISRKSKKSLFRSKKQKTLVRY